MERPNSSFFALTPNERRGILSLAVRMRGARNGALALLLPACVLAPLTYGPWVLIPPALIVLGFAVLGFKLQRPKRLEIPLVGALLWAQVMLAAMIAVASQYRLDGIGLLILPAAGACLLLPRRFAGLYVAWTTLFIVAVGFAIDTQGVLDAPPTLILPVGVLLCVSLPAIMVRQLEVESHDTAMTDPLTGALNRVALELRLSELSEQGSGLPLRVGVLMADLDHFKSVNDELGHAVGDIVLQETVKRMRSELGPLTPIYRAGGEEFVALIAGADAQTIAEIGERLRLAVRESTIEDRLCTVSIGAAASTLDRFTPKALLEAADAALYDAKRSGRDRIAVAETGTDETQAPATADSGGPDGTVFAVVPQPKVRSASEARPGAVTRRAALAATPVSFGHDDRNWLVRGEFEREHIRTSARAMARTHHGALGMIGLALAASIPWLGFHLMLPAILPVVAYHAAERRIRKLKRPELSLGLAWLSVQAAIFAGALIVDPGEPYMLILFVPMMIGVTAVFPSRGITVATVLTLALCLFGMLGARPDLITTYPGLGIPPVLLIAGFALMSSVAGRSAIEFRTQAIVDPLTGLLTRAALTARLEELGKQSTLDGAVEVSVVAFDVDAFKTLNDTYGHATGDDVLRAVGEATRSHLRALEWGFRLGGDEFMVVVPVGEAQAAQLAGTLRAAIAAIDVGGVGITGSFGVAALPSGERFDFDALSSRADAALYEAKRGGRNRVAIAPQLAVAKMAGAA